MAKWPAASLSRNYQPRTSIRQYFDLNEDSSASIGGRRRTIEHAPDHFRDQKKASTNKPRAKTSSCHETAGDTNANVYGANKCSNENNNNTSTSSWANTSDTDNGKLDNSDVFEDGDKKIDVSRLT